MMLTPEEEKIIAAWQRADGYTQTRRIRVKELKMPDDAAGWLTELEALVPAKVAELPSHIQDEFTSLFAEQIKAARGHLAKGKDDDLWMMIALLFDNFEIVRTNIDKHVAYTTQDQHTGAGISSGEQRAAERAPEWQKWQQEAERIFQKNKGQSKNQVCIAVAEKFGVTAKAVSNRVKNVGKERRRSKK